MMEEGQHELRRSQKVQDFAGSATQGTITRERSFVRQHHHQGQNINKRRSQILTQTKNKPSIEIYRPPSMCYNPYKNVRSDGQIIDQINPKLNVHAKEFTMRQQQYQQQQNLLDLQSSRSSVNLPRNGTPVALQHSRSSGNILRHPLTALPLQMPAPQQHHVLPIPLLQSASSGSLMQPLPRVHFQFPSNLALSATAAYRPQQQHQPQQKHLHFGNAANLKRSKSMSAADSSSLAAKLKSLALQTEAPDLGEFPADIQANLQMALDDPNKLPPRTLMELAKHIMERTVEGRRYSLPGAKLCATIIERERTETFLESLINICQQWYQERDRILRNVRAGDGSRFTAFMWFLTEMSCQLKRLRLQNLDSTEGESPGLVLLTLLVRCCQACVRPPIRSLAEVECLFFVLTSIGRDLEQELPGELNQLLTSVRDGFLASAALPAVRKTLLQLIELKASNWQLSGPTVLYYYPKMK